MVTNSRMVLRLPMRVSELRRVFLILRRDANTRVRIEDVVFADRELAFEIDVRYEARARADCHAGRQ